MLGSIVPLLILPLLFAMLSLVALPAQAQTLTFGPAVRVSNTNAGSVGNSVAVVSPNVYVAWNDGGPQPKNKFSRSTDGGATFSSAIDLFTGNTFGMRLAAAGSNVYAALSIKPKPNKTFQVYFRRSTDSGSSFATQVQLSNATGGEAYFETLAVSGDNVHVVWRQNVGGGRWDAFIVSSNDGGATWGAPVNLSTGPLGGVNSRVSVAADGSGVHVAWETSNSPPEIYFRGSSDGGLSFGSMINVSNSPFVASYLPKVAARGSTVYVAFQEAEYRIAVSGDGGLTFGVPMDVSVGRANDGGAGPVQIVATGTALHYIWHGNQSGNYEVYYQRSVDNGATFSLPINISNSADNSTGVVAAAGANVYVAWHDQPTNDVYLRHSGDNGTTFGAAINVSNTPAETRGPVLFAVSSPTQIHVGYTDLTPGNLEVFHRVGTIP